MCRTVDARFRGHDGEESPPVAAGIKPCRSHRLGSLFVAGVLLVASPLPLRAANAAEASISIDNFTFTPAELTVVAGTQVTWINHDDIPHLVVDSKDPQAMKSPPLDTGDKFAFIFAKPGRYPYFCALHPHMQGTVVVK
jgi:plastocyanin